MRREVDVRSGVAEQLLISNRSDRALVREVNPVVQAVQRRVHAVLRVRAREACEDLALEVRLAVAVRVLEIEDIRRVGDDNPALPPHEARGQTETVGKNRALVGASVPIAVLQQDDASGAAHVERIAVHFDDVRAAVFVHLHRDGI
jgi:hypothetical protein